MVSIVFVVVLVMPGGVFGGLVLTAGEIVKRETVAFPVDWSFEGVEACGVCVFFAPS